MAKPGTTFEWLECSRCHVAADAQVLQNLCRCGGVLLARYRLDEAARTLKRRKLEGRPPTQWRYAEVLPGADKRHRDPPPGERTLPRSPRVLNDDLDRLLTPLGVLEGRRGGLGERNSYGAPGEYAGAEQQADAE